MRDTMGIIVANDEKIPPITDKRAIAAMPIAGRYRVIDFVLSNMSNAGIYNIGVVTETNYSSLMDHLKSGKPWDLDRKKQGLNILPPNLARFNYGNARGVIDMLTNAEGFLAKCDKTYVILSLGNVICNIDFEDVLEKHLENQADITIVYKDMQGVDEETLSRYTLIELDDDSRVTDIEIKPSYPKTSCAGLEFYVMEKALLQSIIDECTARGDHDFVRDALCKKMGGTRIFGYEFKGYIESIDSIKSYFTCSMDFLNEKIRNELFSGKNPIYTKTKDQSPTRYGDSAAVENSFISDGCVIEGTVKNSILSRGVKVEKGAVVKNSILMQDSVVSTGVTLDYVIFDKEVTITEGRRLIGQKSFPLAIAKGTTI